MGYGDRRAACQFKATLVYIELQASPDYIMRHISKKQNKQTKSNRRTLPRMDLRHKNKREGRSWALYVHRRPRGVELFCILITVLFACLYVEIHRTVL